MSSLTHLEKRLFEELFNMSGGYVLDFSDQKYADFFREVVSININDQKYFVDGNSKAKRLRYFWKIESDAAVGKVLEQMLAVWLHIQRDRNKALTEEHYLSAKKAVDRLLGKKSIIVNTEDDFLRVDFSKTSLLKLLKN